MGRRIEASEFIMPMVDFALPPPHVFGQVRPMVTVTHNCWLILIELFNSALTRKLCVKVEDFYSVFMKYFLNFKLNKISPPFSDHLKKIYSTNDFISKFTNWPPEKNVKLREKKQNNTPFLWCIDKNWNYYKMLPHEVYLCWTSLSRPRYWKTTLIF
jgi:hypothetical protein